MSYEIEYELASIQRRREDLDRREKELLDKKARGLKKYHVSIEKMYLYFIEAEDEDEALEIYESRMDDPDEIHTFELPVVEEA